MKNIDLYHEQKYCSSFRVTGICKMHNTNHIYAMVWFEKSNLGIDREVAIPIKDAVNLKFGHLIPEGFVIVGQTLKETQKCIYDNIGKVLHTAIVGKLLQQGYNYVDDRWVYVLGDTIINGSSQAYYPYNPRGLKIDLSTDDVSADVEEDCIEWTKWCKSYCKAGDAQAAMFLCALTPYLYPITEALRLPSKVVNAFVLGRSGTGKTSYAKLLTDIGDGNPAGVNLNSDKKALVAELAENYIDRSFLFDDLNLSSSNREMEKKKTRLSEIVQMSSSEGNILIDDRTVNLNRTSLVITGEFLPNSASTVNRCVLIKFTEEFDADRLTKLQNHKKQYGVFVSKLIAWLCANADELVEMVQKYLDDGHFDYNASQIIPTEYVGYSRIINSYKLLKIVQILVMQFFAEQGLFESQEKYRKLNDRLDRGISRTISDTLEEVSIKQGVPDILAVIAETFANNADKVVAKKHEQYFDGPKIFFRDGPVYFCRGEALTTYISAKLNRDVNINAISRTLARAGLLEPYGGTYSAKRSSCPDVAGKVDNRRFYRLRVYALIDLVNSLYPNYLERTQSPIKELRPKKYR